MIRARHKNKSPQNSERGYVLLIFTLFAALLVAGMYMILPKYVFEGQRQKEEELLFRAQQYTRAIQLFVRKNGRYPNTLDELDNTNQIRYLRKKHTDYGDPMNNNGAWRLIHVVVGPGGPTFTDLVNPLPSTNNKGTSGNPGEQDVFRRGFGGSPPSTGGSGSSGSGGSATGGAGSGSGSGATDSGSSGSNAGSTGSSGGSSGGTSSQTFGSGGAIAGVASKNENEAIKVINGFHHYNEWEFVYNYLTDPVAVKRMGAVQPAQPAQPVQSVKPGQPVQTPPIQPTGK